VSATDQAVRFTTGTRPVADVLAVSDTAQRVAASSPTAGDVITLTDTAAGAVSLSGGLFPVFTAGGTISGSSTGYLPGGHLGHTSSPTFTDYRPVARYPPITTPWTQARIEEAPAETGPWTTIDTITLSPVDSDPTAPQARSFSTPNATLTRAGTGSSFSTPPATRTSPDPVAHNSPERQPVLHVAELRARYPAVSNTTTTRPRRSPRAASKSKSAWSGSATWRSSPAPPPKRSAGRLELLEVRHTRPLTLISADDAGTDLDLTDAACRSARSTSRPAGTLA
jgi:hypothetical protein